MDRPAMDVEQEEGDAEQLLRAMGLADAHHVETYEALAELGIRADARVPKGCKGFTGIIPTVVRIPARGTPLVIQQVGRHELGHIAKSVGGERFPHDDESSDRTGLRVEMPRAGVLRAWGRCGGDLVQLASEYPLVSPYDVFRRVAWARGWSLVLWIGRRRIPPANDVESLTDIFRESALLDAVLATRRPANDAGGAVAAPFDGAGRRGVAILLPPRVA